MEAYILYFKSIVERDEDAENWHTFWEMHEPKLKEKLSRGSYLRFKENPLKEMYNILAKHGYEYPEPANYRHWKFHRPMPIPKSWLTKKMDREYAFEILSSEHFQEKLKAIRLHLKPTDEFWTFSSHPNTWGSMMGRSGIAIVRAGIPYDSIIRMMN